MCLFKESGIWNIVLEQEGQADSLLLFLKIVTGGSIHKLFTNVSNKKEEKKILTVIQFDSYFYGQGTCEGNDFLKNEQIIFSEGSIR